MGAGETLAPLDFLHVQEQHVGISYRSYMWDVQETGSVAKVRLHLPRTLVIHSVFPLLYLKYNDIINREFT